MPTTTSAHKINIQSGQIKRVFTRQFNTPTNAICSVCDHRASNCGCIIRPHDNLTSITRFGRTGIDLGTSFDHDICRILFDVDCVAVPIRIGTLITTTNKDGTATQSTGDIEQRTGCDFDLRSLENDLTLRLHDTRIADFLARLNAHLFGCPNTARILDLAASGQHDATTFFGHTCGADHAGIVDRQRILVATRRFQLSNRASDRAPVSNTTVSGSD